MEYAIILYRKIVLIENSGKIHRRRGKKRLFRLRRVEMIKDEAKIMETDAVTFPMKFSPDLKEKVLVEKPENQLVNEEKSVENKAADRFARLKKSLRKKSVSIL